MKRYHVGSTALVLLLSMVIIGSATTAALGQNPDSADWYLPDPADLPGDWAITDEGERTKSEVAAAIGPNGDDLLTSWRWRENVYRDLTRIDPASFPFEVTYISTSVHRFAGAEGASEALTTWSDLVVEAQGLQDIDAPAIGDESRALVGPGDGINLYILYVRSEKYIVRYGASSARGDPQPTIEALAARLLSPFPGETASLEVTPVAPGPDLPVPIVNGCWNALDRTVSATGELSFRTRPEFVIDASLEYYADIHTALGTFRVKLDVRQSPEAVNNFVCLANAGFYDGTAFFRTIPGFLVQGGDPTGTGTGGAGYDFPIEPNNTNYAAGAIAYANASPDRNGSQFFIAVGDLNGAIASDFQVFGHVVDGMEVVERIAETNIQATFASPASGHIGVVTIDSVEIVAHPPVAGPFLTPSATSAVVPSAASPSAGAIVLDAKDIAFDPTEITIKAANEPVTIKMENTGAAMHNFTIDSLNISVDVQPGETVDIVIPAGTAPGTYDFYCNVPGHKEAGMVGTLTVE